MSRGLCFRTTRRAAALAGVVMLVGCAPRPDPSAAVAARQSLTATDWVLTELAGSPVVAGTGGRAPSLRFAAEEARVTGFTGCNQLMGQYSLEGDRLTFAEPLATTRAACVEPAVAQQEQRFLGALRQTRRSSVQGRQLTLHGQADEPLARFSAGG